MINPELLATLDTAAIKGVTKLTELMNRKGKFIYSYDHVSGARPKQYNLVRHAGAIWSMLTVAGETVIPFARLGIRWLVDDYAAEYHREQTFWYGQPKLYIGISWHGNTSLGANALALLALAEMYRIDIDMRGDKFTDVINGLMYGIANAYQYEADSFVHKWDSTTLVPIDFISDYYVGEALFAVLHWLNVSRHVNATPEPMHDKIRDQMFKHMLKLAGENYGLEFQSHWMMYAVAYAMQHWRLEFSQEGQDLLLNYLVKLVSDVLDRTDYRKRNASTPIACRTEGMMAAMQIFLLPEINRDAKYAEFIERIMTHAHANILLQMGFAQADGAIVHGGKPYGYNEVRIDYIQHGISSFKAFVDIARRLQ
jgi:hypothetical protein